MDHAAMDKLRLGLWGLLMANKPTTLFTWAFGAGANVTTIPGAVRQNGFQDGDPARADYVNQALSEASLSESWIDALTWSSQPGVDVDSFGVVSVNQFYAVGAGDLGSSGGPTEMEYYFNPYPERWSTEFPTDDAQAYIVGYNNNFSGGVVLRFRPADGAATGSVVGGNSTAVLHPCSPSEYTTTGTYVSLLGQWRDAYTAVVAEIEADVSISASVWGLPPGQEAVDLTIELRIINEDGSVFAVPWSTSSSFPTGNGSISITDTLDPAQETVPGFLDYGIPRSKRAVLRIVADFPDLVSSVNVEGEEFVTVNNLVVRYRFLTQH